MRTIKFRAWSTEKEHKMIYLDPSERIYHFTSTDLLEAKDWKVMQFTGLKDKNGKEIYEGDIIKYGVSGIGEIIFGDGAFQIKYNDGEHQHPFVMSNMKLFEVIGNIYENPKLLRK